jgi:SNF2 family DNA or RNA helicase
MKLKQICNICPQSGESVKLDDLAERAQTLAAEGHRALVFSQFTDDLFGVRAIASRLAEHRPLIYTGAMSQPERQRMIELFKSDERHRLFVISLKAGGQGLNLQEASYVVHYDRWWNPAVERQAEDRSHRMGQRVPVTVYTYVCVGTIEDRIEELLIQKQALFDTLIDDVSLDLGNLLSAAELFGLFGLRPPS